MFDRRDDFAAVEQIELQCLRLGASLSYHAQQIEQHSALVLVELEFADQTNWIISNSILLAAVAKFLILHVKYPAPDAAFRWI